jgi:hypothetical protein
VFAILVATFWAALMFHSRIDDAIPSRAIPAGGDAPSGENQRIDG